MNAAERRRLPFEPGTPMPGVLYIPEKIQDEFMERIMEAMMKPIEDQRSVKRVGNWHQREIWEVSGEPLRQPKNSERRTAYRHYSEETGCYLWHTPPSNPVRPQNLVPLVTS